MDITFVVEPAGHRPRNDSSRHLAYVAEAQVVHRWLIVVTVYKGNFNDLIRIAFAQGQQIARCGVCGVRQWWVPDMVSFEWCLSWVILRFGVIWCLLLYFFLLLCHIVHGWCTDLWSDEVLMSRQGWVPCRLSERVITWRLFTSVQRDDFPSQIFTGSHLLDKVLQLVYILTSVQLKLTRTLLRLIWFTATTRRIDRQSHNFRWAFFSCYLDLVCLLSFVTGHTEIRLWRSPWSGVHTIDVMVEDCAFSRTQSCLALAEAYQYRMQKVRMSSASWHGGFGHISYRLCVHTYFWLNHSSAQPCADLKIICVPLAMTFFAYTMIWGNPVAIRRTPEYWYMCAIIA